MKPQKIAYDRDGFLDVVGDCERLDVYRSDVVKDGDWFYKPVLVFTAMHGLVPVRREVGEYGERYFGQVEHTVYGPPGTSFEELPPHRDLTALIVTPEEIEAWGELRDWAKTPPEDDTPPAGPGNRA